MSVFTNQVSLREHSYIKKLGTAADQATPSFQSAVVQILPTMLRFRCISLRVVLLVVFCAFVSVLSVRLDSNNQGVFSLDLFRKNWSAYRKVIEEDYMEHKSMSEQLSSALMKYIHEKNRPVRLADVGCGDLALLASTYRSLPMLTAFTGVDLSQPALDLAQKELSHTEQSMTIQWKQQDLLEWSQEERESHEAVVMEDGTTTPLSSSSVPSDQKYDVVVCAFSVHHLHDDQKQQFLRNIFHHRLKKGGIILMADVFMTLGETRDMYMDRFSTHIEKTWTGLQREQVASILEHVLANDFPANLDTFISNVIPAVGATAEVLWSDTPNFEKLLLIRSV